VRKPHAPWEKAMAASAMSVTTVTELWRMGATELAAAIRRWALGGLAAGAGIAALRFARGGRAGGAGGRR
jgi:hypothetical protein